MGCLAGLIYTSRVKQGSLSALATDQFTGLTAAILGGISFGGGSGGMGGAFIGLLVIKTFNKGMTIIGASSYVTNVLSGALLLAALSFDYYSQRRQRKRIGA
jgi:ribose/xylose/arabinose/galactoside ABC-type transport system permease subunit